MRHLVSGKDRTEEYVKAVDALRLLMTTQNSDSVTRAYAEVVADENRESFVKTRGLKKSNGSLCIQRLSGKQCNYKNCAPPAGDHDTLWIKDGEPALYLMQPYGLTWDDMKNLVAFCAERKLQASVSAGPSFHFAGRVISVEIEKDTTLQ